MSYSKKVLYLCEYAEHLPGDATGYARIERKNGVLTGFVSVRQVGQVNWQAYLCQVNKKECTMEPLGMLEKQGDNCVLTIGRKPCKIDMEQIRIVLLDAVNGEKHYMASRCLAGCLLRFPETETSTPVNECIHIAQKAPESWSDKILSRGVEMYPFEDDEMSTCVKLDLADISNLPSSNWVLQKNSFLLQGYYAYRHILLAVKDEEGKRQCFLGIPGVFHRRDRFMANMFGFSHFKGVHDKQETLGDFGYWFKPVNEK